MASTNGVSAEQAGDFGVPRSIDQLDIPFACRILDRCFGRSKVGVILGAKDEVEQGPLF